ncbi:MAG TPA: hypothetical protein VI248_29340 [Kineosporiaceae bacterium]
MSRDVPTPPVWWVALAAALALDVGSIYRATAQPASDVRTYHQWITGPLPSWTAAGPYPVGADLLWWPLRWLPGPVNVWWLVACTGPATGLACLVLWRTAGRPLIAVTVWLTAAGLLERSYWMRLEPVAALAALLMVVGVRRGRVAGPALVLSGGALVKVWPAFLLPTALLLPSSAAGRPAGRPAQAAARRLGWFALPWVVYGLAVLVLRPPHATTWLTFTLTRRSQAESLSVLPALWSMAAGGHTWHLRYVGGLDSADIVTGPHLRAARLVLQLVAVAVLAVLAARVVPVARRRGAGTDGGEGLALVLVAQVAALLVIIFAGPAFSPQYLVWFAPLLAVAAGDGRLGRETALWLVGCALTFVEFPLLWNEMRAADPVAVTALTARDAVLAVLLGLCLWRVLRATGPRRVSATDRTGVRSVTGVDAQG